MERRTKIIATIGPATLDSQVFKQLVEEGADMVRINTSYGDYEQYDQILANAKNLEVIYDIKDESKLDYFLKNNLTWVAVSFVDNAQKISDVRNKLPGVFIIAKIESVAGVNNFDQILAVTDGIMTARGDLSEAETVEKVPVLQKQLSQKTKAAGKYLITATEMLLSMVENEKPEIAEVSDVANAVFDGSEAVMLSEETAIGKHPIEAVSYMRRTIEEAEKFLLRG